MKTHATKKLFLENLKRVPIIQVACEKSGVSRATIYRWRDKDKKFKKSLEEALSEGEALVNDMGESQLITLIREKNFPAIRFWLNHRHEKFKERVKVTAKIEKQENLTPEQEEVVREALRLAAINDNGDVKNK
ncbi:MAG: phBC6A51 family helix-turn-helix protein [Minisyncoccota bacterium]